MMPMGIEDRAQLDELSLLFNERMLARIIETGDGNLVSGLFANLQADWLTLIRGQLLDNWLSWKGTGACWSAVRIAELAPKEFCVERNDPCPCGSGKKYKKCCA
jgi:hypothetical protein